MKNAEISFDSDPENPQVLNIEFSGELNISNTPAFRDLLIQKLKNKTGINITTNGVESLDLSFYQLLLSIKKTFQEKEKPINIHLKLPAENEELLRQAGFEMD